ncbi:MAG: hypothetical protein JNM69_08340 [Archangium sp.]|nr:hypothetical protein [Archangium sp.]
MAPLALGSAALGTAVAAAWFWAHPSAVLIGTSPGELLVPWYYQASAFPPLCVLLTTAIADLVSRRRVEGVSALALCVACSLVALVRLAGLIPLSGHGLFLSAVLVFELRRGPASARAAVVLATLGLCLTAFFKLFVWHDALNFGGSVVIGSVIGWAASIRSAPRVHDGST